MKWKKVAIGCDHAGFELKEILKKYIQEKHIEVEDFGTHSSESVDYPDYAHPLANSVESGKNQIGFTICGSGNGINMTLNKYAEIRSALCWNTELAKLARLHNNANVIALPSRFIDEETAKECVFEFLNTDFEGGRHERRVEKIKIK